MRSNIDHWFSCEHPKLITNPYTNEKVLIPCGSCPSCRLRHITRLLPSILREGFSHKYVMFITLTYSDEFLPSIDLNNFIPDSLYRKRYENLKNLSKDFIEFYNGIIPICNYSDVQKFLKRLRSKIQYDFGEECQIRYVICGDYGSTTFRPHYHGLLFFDKPGLFSSIGQYVSQAWSVRVSNGQRQPIGIIECESAYDAGSYVASYSQAVSELPLIYTYRDFKPKCLHSSSPSLGSLVKPVESVREIVDNGLHEITIYDPKTYAFRKVALSPSYIYRLFPTITSYASLSLSERLEIYRTFGRVQNLTPFFRRLRLKHIMNCNSFIYDYITCGKSLTMSQIDRKLDCIYYTVKRLYVQSSSLGYSVSEYDSLIEKFYFNGSQKALKFQLEYNDRYNLNHCSTGVPSHIDCKTPSTFDNIHPLNVDPLFFNKQHSLLNSFVKRKCDNNYLEKHPEFKQFHS